MLLFLVAGILTVFLAQSVSYHLMLENCHLLIDRRFLHWHQQIREFHRLIKLLRFFCFFESQFQKWKETMKCDFQKGEN